MQVGRFIFDGPAKQVINADSHMCRNPAILLVRDVSTRIAGGQGSRNCELRRNYLPFRTVCAVEKMIARYGTQRARHAVPLRGISREVFWLDRWNRRVVRQESHPLADQPSTHPDWRGARP